MSTVDSLLDLGEPAPPVANNQTNNADDPFDPLSPSTGSSGSTKSPDQELSLDPFDPFAAASANMSASNGNAMSDDQVKSMEQQFDDLLDLGGFTSSTEVTTSTTTTTKTTTNGDLLGDFEPIEAPGSPTGDVVSVTRELEDGTTIVETTTTTTAESEEYVDLDIVNGTDNSQEPYSTDSFTSRASLTLNPTHKESPDTSTDEGALDTSESKIPEAEIQLSTPSQPRLEDQLADYQPPKQYVKREDKQSRASPALLITDTRKDQPSTPRMSQERDNDTSAEYSVEPSKPFKSLKQTWGTPAGDSDNYCKVCNKRVYEMEKIYENNAAYHKTCFRCSHCNSVLRLGNFAAMDGALYCKPHFISIFKTKGNYDEGFGKEKHSKQWTNKDTPTREAGPKANHSEEAYEELPHTDDLRRNFEDDVDGERREVIRETQEKDTVHFTQLTSVRSKFESASHSPIEPSFTPKSSRPPSKWDKPKDTPPAPVVNRTEEKEYDDQSSPDEGYRGVRQLTPPPDMVDGEVREVYESEPVHDPKVIRHDDKSFREDELPPPSMAKNILAKFRSMEDVNAPPLSPESNRKNKQTSSRSRTPQREVTPPVEPVTINGDQETYSSSPEQPSIEDNSTDQELPERGFTRSLVAQWKTREQSASPAVTPVSKHSVSRTPKSTQRHAHTTHREPSPELTMYTATLANGDSPDGQVTHEVVHADDTNLEDELPPPAMARNMRNMFEDMAVEKQREAEATTPRSARKFKFAVKETGFHVRTPHKTEDAYDFEQHNHQDISHDDEDGPFHENVAESIMHDAPETDYAREHEQHYAHEHEHTNILEEELPPTAFTRNMLAKFRSMEDVSKPPPTPELAEQQHRLLARDSPHRLSNPNIRALSVSSQGAHDMDDHEPREQPDGDETTYDYYQNEAEGGVFENEPEYHSNVVHESDRNDEAEMPEHGTTRNLLAKFQTLQAH